MRDRPNRQPVRRTPKVFRPNYQAPTKSFNWAGYRSLWPVVWVVLVVAGLFLIGRLPALRVETIQTVGTSNNQVNTALDSLKGQSLLSGNLTNNITKISLNLPVISSLACQRGIPGTLKCRVSLRQSALTWKSGGSEFLVDATGVAYAAAPVNQTGLIVEDKSAAPVKLGHMVASAEIVGDFTKLADLLTTNHLTFSELYVNDTLYQCGAELTGSTDPNTPFAAVAPISALFTFDQPLTGQVATLVQILKQDHAQITNHVDLRVPGYAYIQ